MNKPIEHSDSLPRRDMLKRTAVAGLSIGSGLHVLVNAAEKPHQKSAPATVDSIFSSEEILDESTLEATTLQDWHIDTETGSTRQKLVEINVAQWWPGQDYRIPVRLIVPLEGKAQGFSITGANPYELLMKDSRLTDFQAQLLAGGVGIVKALRQIPGRQRLEQRMRRVFLEDLNPRYTTVWIWSMTPDEGDNRGICGGRSF